MAEYPMDLSPKGHCVIINNVKFSGAAQRIGSDQDSEKLKVVFGPKFLDFKVSQEDNVSEQKLYELMSHYQHMDHSAYNAFVVIILSHGSKGGVIYSSDHKEINISNIAGYFTAEHCPSLYEKPKVFIIQACRGQEHQNQKPALDQSINYDGGSATINGELESIPNKADTLYAYATVDDYVALRDTQCGSWYIQVLIDVIEEQAMKKSFTDILTEVNSKLSCKTASREPQVAEFVSNMRKKLFLFSKSERHASKSKMVVTRQSNSTISTHSSKNSATVCTSNTSSLVTSQSDTAVLPIQTHGSCRVLQKKTLEEKAISVESDPLPSKIQHETVHTSSTSSSNSSVHNLPGMYPVAQNCDHPQGYCVIINNNTSYYGEEQIYEIKGILRNVIGFHVQVYQDLTCKGIQNLLSILSDVDHSQLYALVVIIFSKGKRKRLIYGSKNNKMQPKEVVEMFKDKTSLSGKPKLFFFETHLSERDLRATSGPIDCDDSDSFVYFATYFDELPGKCSFIQSLLTTLRAGESTSTFQQVMENSKQRFVQSEAAFDIIDNSDRFEKPLCFTKREFQETTKNSDDLLSHEDAMKVNDYKLCLKMWLDMREVTINILKEKRDTIIQVCQDARKARIAGSATSLVGGAIAIAGLALAPVTLGASIGVSVAGAAIGATGGVILVTSTATEHLISQSKLKKANSVIQVDKQLSEMANKLSEEVDKVVTQVYERAPYSKEAIANTLLQGTQLVRAGTIAAKGGLVGATAARVGATTVLQGGIFAARVGGAAVRGVAIAGGVVSVLIIPLDIAELIYNSYKLHKQSKTDIVQVFDAHLEELESQKAEVEKQLSEEHVN